MSEESKELAPRGLGMGGLGGFADASEFEKAVKDSAGDVGHGSATAEDIRDAMGNVIPKLEKVKVKHGGACLFQFPDNTKAEELVGAVVAYTFHNSFFDKAFEEREDGERPPCFSADGATVSDRAEGPKHTDCGTCPRNRDATLKEAREAAFKAHRKEACNNYISLAVAIPGREVPVQIQLSNTSFKPWAAYIQSIGTQGRFRPHEVATRFKLVNRTGAGGSEYSVCHFELIGALPKDIAASFASQAGNYRNLLRRTSDEASDSEHVEAAAAVADAKAAQEAAAQSGAAL